MVGVSTLKKRIVAVIKRRLLYENVYFLITRVNPIVIINARFGCLIALTFRSDLPNDQASQQVKLSGRFNCVL